MADARAGDDVTPSDAGWIDPATDLTPVRHPLLSDEARDLVAQHPELSVEELYAHLTVMDEIVELETGVGEHRSFVTFNERDEPIRFSDTTLEPLPPFTTDETVGDWMALVSVPPEVLDVDVVFARSAWDRTVSVPHQQALAMLRGEVSTKADLFRVKQEVMAQRRAEGEAAMADALAEVEAMGGEVVSLSGALGTARLRLGVDALMRLAERPEVSRIEEWSEGTEDAVGYSLYVEGPLDGIEIADLLQSEPYYTWGYDGRIEAIGHTEPKDPRTDHVSFYGANGIFPRLWHCGGTGSGTCSWVYTTSGFEHPTKTAGIIVSDLTLSQDSNFTNTDDRRRRSGIARGSLLFHMKWDDWIESKLVDNDVKLLNQSANYGADSSCLGATANAVKANGIYEAGVALLNSAGNNFHPNPTDCTVGATASAIGALAINAIRVSDAATPPFLPGQVPSVEDIHNSSSQGGTGVVGQEGNGRTVVAFNAYTGHNFRAEADPAASPQYAPDTHRFGVTSAAAPMATGGAELFRDWYIAEQSDLVDEPGILYANLHLMTDGLMKLPTEDYDLNGYDSLYGGGRLRLRAFDADGLDGPAGWFTGSLCVQQGWTQVVQVNAGNPVPADVDYLKFVTWTYDHGQDDYPGAGHDKFKVVASSRPAGGGAWTQVVQDASADNRHRVFVDEGVGGKQWRLEVTGTNVTSNGEGCGDVSNRVYYAGVWEENDRDDDATLSTFVRPEPGVGF